MSLTFIQSIYFNQEDIDIANKNIDFIEKKIKEIGLKMNRNHEDDKILLKQQSHINRLTMSKDCIKYYYKID